MGEHRVPAVLIVDDTYPFSKLIHSAFARRGFAVYCAASPDRGLALFEANRPHIDLLVVDILAPAAPILDLTAELERRQPGLSVLYLAGDRKTIARCSIEAHAPESVLVAPFSEEQLLARVDRLLSTATDQRMPDELLWDRLIAASYPIADGATMLYLYESHQAPLAAGHMAMLRSVKICSAFRLTNDAATPYCMVIPAAEVPRACSLIAGMSIGKRLVPAA